MDPNANLENILSDCLEILDHDHSEAELADLATDLAEHVANLHQWIRQGGCLPKLWERK